MMMMSVPDRLQTTHHTRSVPVIAVWLTAVQIVTTVLPTEMGARLSIFGNLDYARWLALFFREVGNVETNPGPITTRKQVWISNICHTNTR